MSRQEKRLQQIERSALREAQKALRQHPEQPVTREELLSKRVQVLTDTDRIALFVVSLLFGGAGIYFVVEEYHVLFGCILIAGALALLIFGVIGWRRTLAEAAGAAVELVIQAVFKSLDGL